MVVDRKNGILSCHTEIQAAAGLAGKQVDPPSIVIQLYSSNFKCSYTKTLFVATTITCDTEVLLVTVI